MMGVPTEALERRRALRESEARYEALLDGVQDHAIFMLDPNGTIMTWNAGAARIKGYGADEIIGRNSSCFFPAADVARGRPAEVLRIAAAHGRHEEQSIRLRKDGSRFLAHVTFTALRGTSGELRGFCEFSHDLSARQASDARYRGLLEAAPDAMVVVDEAGDIVLVNAQAEKRFGYRRDELVGRKMIDIIPDGFAARLIADALRSDEDALAQQIGSGIELTGRRKDESEFPIEIMLSPLDSDGAVLVTVAIRDISRRNETATQLRLKMEELNRSNVQLEKLAGVAAAANNELEAFAYSVSHDLRAPLRSLDGFSAVLLEDYADKLDAEGRDSLERIRAASQRMGHLIDDMLSLSQLTRHQIATSRVDLTGMAVDIAAELREAHPTRHVELVVAPGLVAETDPKLMHIVLANLLGNAWKFTGKRVCARIELGVVEREGRPVYFVADNGAGFDMAYAGKLFGAFQRMHSTAEFEGTGIGLATVQRVIHRLGGEVWAEASLDRGATIYFALKPGGNP